MSTGGCRLDYAAGGTALLALDASLFLLLLIDIVCNLVEDAAGLVNVRAVLIPCPVEPQRH